MSKNGSNSADLKELLDKAAEQLRIGNLHLWTRVELARKLQGKQDVWQLSPVFFTLTLNGLRDESILYLARLVETRNETLNLRSIKKWLEKNEGLVPLLTAEQVRSEVLPRLTKEIEAIKGAVKKISRIRSEEIAHLNLALVTGRRQAGCITYPDVENAYQQVHRLLDWLSETCLGQGIGMIEIFGSADFEELIGFAQSGFNSKLEQLRGGNAEISDGGQSVSHSAS